MLNEAGFLDDPAMPQSDDALVNDILPMDVGMNLLDRKNLRRNGDSENDRASHLMAPTSNHVPLALHLASPQSTEPDNLAWDSSKNSNAQSFKLRSLNIPFQHPLPSTSSSPSSPSSNNMISSRFRSTGTTIAGCVVAGGTVVLLGADTRATNGQMVADKTCFKIHTLGRNVACCGAGTAGDLDAMTRQLKYSLALQCLQEDSIGNFDSARRLFITRKSNPIMEQEESSGIWVRPVSFSRVCRLLRDTLYEAGGNLGAYLIVGGVDSFQKNDHNRICGRVARLVAIHPHGSMDVVPYAALGSGGMAAMAVLEQRYRPDMTVEEGMVLIQQAITAGIRNDMGSGSQVDLCVIQGAEDDQPVTLNITRASVPEERLEAYSSGKTPAEEHLDLPSTSGVDGFGNLPYQVLSRRIISSIDDNEERKRKWSDLLGL